MTDRDEKPVAWQRTRAMTHDELIEAVARAIYEEDDPWHKAWPWPDLQSDQAGVEQYRRIARAAISVIAPTVLEQAAGAAMRAVLAASLSKAVHNEIHALKEGYSHDQ